MPKRPRSVLDLPQSVPVFPLSGALLLPRTHRPLNVFEPRYLAMVDDALAGDRLIGIIQPQGADEESPQGEAPLRTIGCLGRLTHFEESAENRYFIILEGVTRFRVLAEEPFAGPYRRCFIDAAPYAGDFTEEDASSVDRSRFLKMMRDYAEFANFELNWDEIDKTATNDLVNFCCMVSPYGPAEKQALLEAKSLNERAETLIAIAELEMARGGTGAPLQ